MHPRYLTWLTFVFDRRETPNGWYFDLEDEDFGATPQELVELIVLTMESSGKDLADYGDRQVAEGLNYIVNNACSSVVAVLFDDAVSVQLRLRAIESIKTLYRDCFAPRCASVLCHTGQKGGNALNLPCYMLWDVFPISLWEGRRDGKLFYAAALDVLEDALDSSNPACVEGALHGLGHLFAYCEEAADVVARYQKRNHYLLPALESYARQASMGNVL